MQPLTHRYAPIPFILSEYPVLLHGFHALAKSDPKGKNFVIRNKKEACLMNTVIRFLKSLVITISQFFLWLRKHEPDLIYYNGVLLTMDPA